MIPGNKGEFPAVRADNLRAPKVGPDTATLWNDIEQLGIASYIGELEVKGFCVIPPHLAAPDGLMDELRAAIARVYQRRFGNDLDIGGNSPGSAKGKKGPLGKVLPFILFEDPAFQAAILNPVTLALVTFMLGRNAILSSCQAALKAAGKIDLMLHADNSGISVPFPAHYQICNVTYALSDYSENNGSIAFVPGSHRLYRQPLPAEGQDQRVAIAAPAGSMIAFNGNVWHGAFARTTPGLRVSLLCQFARGHLSAFEAYRQKVTKELLESHPPRFATLMGQHLGYGWTEEGPDKAYTPYDMGVHAYD
jgi:hypothetical protein